MKKYFNNNYLTKHLLNIQFHIYPNNNILEKKTSSYLYGIYKNINIFNLSKTIWNLKYLYYNLVKLFFEKNSFFIMAIHPTLKLKNLIDELEHDLSIDKNYYLNNNLIIQGAIHLKWIAGFFSNRSIVQNWIKMVKNLQKGKYSKRYKYYRYILSMIKEKQRYPLLPDFILILNNDSKASVELIKSRIPLIGFVNNNINPEYFLYPIFGNNSSLASMEFFFTLLKTSLSESYLYEQEFLYLTILQKVKKILYFKYNK